MKDIMTLFEAIERGDVAEVKRIITTYPKLINTYGAVSSTSASGTEQTSPLLYAVQLQKADIVRLLLEHGADIKQKTNDCCQNDALFLAAGAKKPSLDVIKLLLDAGLDPNSDNECLDQTSLGLAAQKGHIEVVKILLEHGADINRQVVDDPVDTPLMLAAEADQADVVKLLLRNGADPLLKNREGETALAKAMKKGHESVALIIKEAIEKK